MARDARVGHTMPFGDSENPMDSLVPASAG
jgi:hypothetical protein